MGKVDDDTMQDLILWLSSHEDDIEAGINDFDELRGLFFELFDRNAGETVQPDSEW